MPRACPISSAYRKKSADLSIDRRISELAEGQHGVVSRRQLLALGLTNSGVARRIEAGRLHPRHNGVYAVGYPLLGQSGVWMAAVLACGPGAALSHRSSAALLDLRRDGRTVIDVTSRWGSGAGRAGIRAHRSVLDPAETATVSGIPCTSVERTLLDLAGEVNRVSLERAIERAEMLRVLDWNELHRVVERAGPRRGVAALRAVVDGVTEPPEPTRSELERRFLDLCRRVRLPRPLLNAIVHLPDGSVEVDFLWPDARLIAETDGYATHQTRAAFARDRRRDQRLSVAGYRVVRFTWRQVVHEPEAVARTLRALID